MPGLAEPFASPSPSTVHPLGKRASVVGGAVLLGVVFMLLLVFGSGVVPMPWWAIVGSGGLVAVGASLPVVVFGGRPVVFALLTAAAVVGTVLGVSELFVYLHEAAFAHAKDYGTELASAILEIRANRHKARWPSALAEIPMWRRPSPGFTALPFVSSCPDRLCENVAGFFVRYRFETDAPQLVVEHGHVVAEWDWGRKQWRERRS